MQYGLSSTSVGFGIARSRGTGATPWYRAGGAPTPFAAYAAVGAASYAASKINIANPGTYDAFAGTNPSHASGAGWGFVGASSQYLKTGVTIGTNTTWSILVRFSNYSVVDGNLVGIYGGADNKRVQLVPRAVGDTAMLWGNGSKFTVASVGVSAGVIGFAGTTAYFDGVAQGSIPPGAAASLEMYIGCLNSSGSPNYYGTASIMAVVVYTTSTGHATWMPAVSAAMAALTG